MFLHTTIKDEKLREKLRPNFKLGCKRILISDEYYQRNRLKPRKKYYTGHLMKNGTLDKISPCHHLVPFFHRITGFLVVVKPRNSMNKPNFHLDNTQIEKITPAGIKTKVSDRTPTVQGCAAVRRSTDFDFRNKSMSWM